MSSIANSQRGGGRTVLGLERRGLGAAAVVAAVVVLYAIGLPGLADLLPNPHDTVGAGSVVTLADEARFTPASGWVIGDTSDPSKGIYVLAQQAVEFRIVVVRDAESAGTVFDQIADVVRRSYPGASFGTKFTAQTSRGLVGVAGTFLTTTAEGLIEAYSQRGIAVLVVSVGTTGAVAAVFDTIVGMINSIEVIGG